ncbi:MAG: sigma-70 family RNA polymerase sigma factor [Planctomycetes bacterium]|nr:sigma-70 family RNA polymerase sigma factor [Planctomycetota bacterium]
MNSAALRLVRTSSHDSLESGSDPRSQLADEELFALCIDGDRGAFRLLVERYEGKAVHTARGIVGSYETAREVAQEAFLKVYAHRARFDLKRKFSTWFYRILRNQAVDRARRQVAGTPGAASELIGDWNGGTVEPAQEASARERVQMVHEILSGLPEKFRIVLALRDLEGLSCGEIGERVGATAGTVRWRLHHARKLFRDHWERTLGKEEGGESL